ncbi:N-acetyltransferase family protein [Pseudomonas wadenswilerensis]
MKCRVRLAKSEDAAAISRVVIAALRESNTLDYPAEVIAQVEPNFSPEKIAALLDKRKVFVAELGREIFGTASLDGDVVRSVFVDPDCQGRGIGRRLMEVVHAAARSAGIESLRVPSSITAEGFYEGLGYWRIRDEFHGAERTIIMELIL